jgi:hypothetical protein
MVKQRVIKASENNDSSSVKDTLNLVTEGVLGEGINLSEITEVFTEYRKTQDAMKVVKAKLEALKPVLTEMVQNEGGSYTQDGYVGQIVAVPASRVLKTKAEVLVAVPKKYHYQILKDKKNSSHLKVAVAPKPNTVEVEITEQE